MPTDHVIARTNACRTDDLDAAVPRAEAYRAAGADLLLVLPKSPEQAADIGRRVPGPLCAMTLAGMPSLGMTLAEADALGYRLIVDSMTPLLAQQKAVRLAYEAMARGESDPTFGSDFDGEIERIHELIGLDSMLEIERRTVEGPA